MSDYTWKDRKRVCGLPLTFTKYEVAGTRLSVQKGLLNTKVDTMLLYHILDARLQISLKNKIFRVGSIVLFTCDETNKELKLERIKHPKKVFAELNDVIEKERLRARVAGREVIGVSDNEEQDDNNISHNTYS